MPGFEALLDPTALDRIMQPAVSVLEETASAPCMSALGVQTKALLSYNSTLCNAPATTSAKSASLGAGPARAPLRGILKKRVHTASDAPAFAKSASASAKPALPGIPNERVKTSSAPAKSASASAKPALPGIPNERVKTSSAPAKSASASAKPALPGIPNERVCTPGSVTKPAAATGVADVSLKRKRKSEVEKLEEFVMDDSKYYDQPTLPKFRAYQPEYVNQKWFNDNDMDNHNIDPTWNPE